MYGLMINIKRLWSCIGEHENESNLFFFFSRYDKEICTLNGSLIKHVGFLAAYNFFASLIQGNFCK